MRNRAGGATYGLRLSLCIRSSMMEAVQTARRTVLLSGGVDSACLLALALEQGENGIQGLFVDYGQPALSRERAAAVAIAEHYQSHLRQAGVDIGRVTAGEIPGRNALMVHMALTLAPPGPATLLIGIHAGSGYRDCTPEFVQAMQVSLDLHRDGAVQLAAPFLEWGKAEVYDYAIAMGVPLELTYSCEAGSDPPCGECASCHDRRRLHAR
jgi:7-cyano-7-deazaguanine synthase